MNEQDEATKLAHPKLCILYNMIHKTNENAFYVES